MRYISSLVSKKFNRLYLAGVICIFIVLSSLIFSACSIPDAGANNNGSNNGNYNGTNNGNNNNNCNGVNNCNFYNGNPNQQDNSSSNPSQSSQGNQITNTSYAKGECVTVTTQDNENAVVTGDVTINGNSYYDSDPTTGALDIINSNETVNICGEVGGFNLQTNIPSNELQSVVSNDINSMKHSSGCGSTCNSVATNNV